MGPRGDTAAASFGGRRLTEAPESENENQRSNQHRFLLVGPLRRALVVVKITIWTPPVISLNPFPVPVVAFDVDAIAGACVRGHLVALGYPERWRSFWEVVASFRVRLDSFQ